MNAAAELATGYADTLRDYIRAGLVLVPIPAGLKGPRARGWNLRAHCWAKPGQVPEGYSGNVGLAHVYAGTCALDVDHAELAGPALAAHGIDLAALLAAPDAVHIRSGRAGRDKLLFRLRDPLPSINRSAAEGFELRSTAKNGPTVQDVLPPSIHPKTGKPYQWAGDWHNIPPIPADLLTLWRRLLKDSPTTPRTVSQPARATPHGQRRKLPERIPEGERDTTLLSLAAGFVRRGHDLQAVNDRLQRINAERCTPPLGADEVDRIASQACAYGSEGFALLPHKLLDSPEWKALHPRAHDIVLLAFRRYDGTNNGNVALTWGDFDGLPGFAQKHTFYRHRRCVIASGILQQHEGGNTQTGRKPDLFAIAPRWLRAVSPVSKKEPGASVEKVHPYIDKQGVSAFVPVAARNGKKRRANRARAQR